MHRKNVRRIGRGDVSISLIPGRKAKALQGCKTALCRALDLGKIDLATLLLQYEADVYVECPHGVTILNKVNSRRQKQIRNLGR